MNELIMTNLDSSRIKQRILREKSNHQQLSNEVSILMHELKEAKIVEPSLMPPDVVTMNSIVKLSYENGAKTITIQLVYPEEANVNEQKISIFAPLAVALIGSKKGSILQWTINKKPIKLKIEEVVYQPEAAGDYHL